MLKQLMVMKGTLALILVWIILWSLTRTTNIAPYLSGKGLSRIGHEYYRLITAGLTHTNFIHLLVNVLAMFWVGYLYEGHLGSGRFLAIGVVCAVLTQGTPWHA